MMVYLDTEFSDLAAEPKLLSLAMVRASRNDKEFYAEVTDSQRLRAASDFAHVAVLSQFGRVAGAACSYAELGARLWVYLYDLTTTLGPGERIEVAFESDRDWLLATRAVQDADLAGWISLRGRLTPVNVYNIDGFAAGERAARAYFVTQRGAPLSRHHALCDARALRIAYAAAGDAVRSGQALGVWC